MSAVAGPSPDSKGGGSEDSRAYENIYVMGVDLGGTRLRAALADGRGNFLESRRIETRGQEGPDKLIGRIVRLLDELRDQAPQAVSAVGVGAPGPVDSRAGIVREGMTLHRWKDIPLAKKIEGRLGLPVVLGNDANLAALGEFAYGAGRGVRNMVYVTVSTGVGGGVVIEGELLEGHKGIAGELGHMVVEPEGPRCNCGKYGHLEALSSGTAIARQAREALDAGERTLLSQLREEIPGGITAEVVHQAAEEGDSFSTGLLEQAGSRLGYALVSLVHVLNPEVIVVGGGVSGAGDLFLEPLRGALFDGLVPVFAEDLRLEKSLLGDDAGLHGSVELALRAALGNRPFSVSEAKPDREHLL